MLIEHREPHQECILEQRTVTISPPDEIAEALWYIGRGQAEIRQEHLAPPGVGEARVRAFHGGLSRGTDSLVPGGHVPRSEFERTRAPFMAGDFPFPVKHGYATGGRIEGGIEGLSGRIVFALYPHQTLFNIPANGYGAAGKRSAATCRVGC